MINVNCEEMSAIRKICYLLFLCMGERLSQRDFDFFFDHIITVYECSDDLSANWYRWHDYCTQMHLSVDTSLAIFRAVNAIMNLDVEVC